MNLGQNDPKNNTIILVKQAKFKYNLTFREVNLMEGLSIGAS